MKKLGAKADGRHKSKPKGDPSEDVGPPMQLRGARSCCTAIIRVAVSRDGGEERNKILFVDYINFILFLDYCVK